MHTLLLIEVSFPLPGKHYTFIILRAFFLEAILTCRSRKVTGVNNKINGFHSAGSLSHCRGAFVNVISATSVPFPPLQVKIAAARNGLLGPF